MIIIISDDQFFVANISYRLGMMGKRCVRVTQKDDLWTRVGSYPPNIVILDVYCSRMDPIGIMKKLHDEGYQEKIILLGGENHEFLVPEASQFGAIQIVGRPIGVNGVLCAIRIAQEQLQTDQYIASCGSTPIRRREWSQNTERRYAI